MRRLALLPGLLAIAACAVPYEELENIPELQNQTSQVALAPQPDEPLFGDLWRRPVAREVDATPSQTVRETEVASAPTTTSTQSKRPSLISWLTQQAPKPKVSEPTPVLEAEVEKVAVLTEPAEASPVQLASLETEPVERTTIVRNQRRKAKGISKDVPFGTILPFGEIARVCEAKSRPLGKRVAQSEGRGQAYSIYDSAPGSTAARTFYVTGFSDRCPRQLTAALALFGAPSMHERLRYGRPADIHPYSSTDKAYEKVKSQVCAVGRQKPCGARMNQLERDTVFISTYERFTNNGRWSDLLIHDGAVLASAIKAP